jgi:hypothetical protein
MQIKRFIATIAIFAVIGLNCELPGQILGSPGQVANQGLGGSPHTSNPDAAVFDPGNLEYDMQPFAPLDISDYDGDADYSGGFYATFDRTFLNVRRPRPFGDIATRNFFPRGNDWISGNLFTMGNMSPSGSGWDIKYLRTSGSFFNGPAGIGNPMWITTSIHKFELNRSFRQPLTKGGFIEPYFGVRYDYFQDKSIEDDDEFMIDLDDPTILGEGINRFTQSARNSIIGGGVGFRLHQSLGRWSWRSDTGINGGFNTQSWNRSDAQFFEGALLNQFISNAGRRTFTPSFESTCDVTYGISRDVSIRAGTFLSYMWTGVARANTVQADGNPNSFASGPLYSPQAITSQASIVAGFTVGMEWRR